MNCLNFTKNVSRKALRTWILTFSLGWSLCRTNRRALVWWSVGVVSVVLLEISSKSEKLRWNGRFFVYFSAQMSVFQVKKVYKWVGAGEGLGKGWGLRGEGWGVRGCRFPATKNLQGTKPEVLPDGTDNSVRNSKFFEYPRLFIYISIIILLRIRGYFIKHS